jgi:hydroxyacylglutathione hydrolase
VKQVADGVWHLPGFPPDAINVYLVGDVLVDCGSRRAGSRILKQLEGAPGERARAHARAR